MIKKLASIVILAAVLLGGFYFYQQSQWGAGKEITSEDIMATINSIKDSESKDKILDFLSTPAYGVSSSSDSEDTAPDQEDNSKLKATIDKLSKLSGDDLDQEIAKTIEKSIQDNIDNQDIHWNREFVEKYVKQYCPEYYDQLITLVDQDEK